ncbi:MAG: tRNA (adenosine(37)-N6)-dimethylallyltransferase MiaA [Congregibacter sp.]
MPPLLCIMGPTASGKTALAIKLAEALDGELISVDSALVYRGLDIGSAKPAYPHHLIDICEPTVAYSAARFATDARQVIADIRARGKRPILVGGTMLYYRALVQGLDPLPAADASLRAELEARGHREGWPALHKALETVDPVSASRIHPNHSQRLVRALEVFTLTQRPLSEQQGADDSVKIPHIPIAIAPLERRILHERIARRFAGMLEDGFLEEVRQLRKRGDLHAGLPAVRAVGYRQLWAHLDGDYDLDEALRRCVVATRQLAKRQFTSLRKWPQLRWILTDAQGDVLQSQLTVDGANEAVRPSKTTNVSELVLNFLHSNPI